METGKYNKEKTRTEILTGDKMKFKIKMLTGCCISIYNSSTGEAEGPQVLG